MAPLGAMPVSGDQPALQRAQPDVDEMRETRDEGGPPRT